MSKQGKRQGRGRRKTPYNQPLTKDYTYPLWKMIKGCKLEKRAPKAIKNIKDFAYKQMGTSDVRVANGLNRAIWARGIRKPPRKIRLRLQRLPNDDEDAKREMYVMCSLVHVDTFSGLKSPEVVDDE
mmetsp:Transcript_849/g.977  ORF Transcript_849/g.977 Transcript_849/m.977 type:complete len:127 (+) Transcript_849:45-425(+)|eukprot:CAMPEP_0168512702 /NCGR_PEP_ID=MMETSP0405-20121227/2972_1 /TAXON_ID=498012 /ORGANISM="Trichosphaerium sp, Strain Am-I-7 wt" /LENGTH=126 /DNA_ID=CAMNT_0008531289 /DNA_START=26 /DNA_END=406 /DNA_ORIENTATION=+